MGRQISMLKKPIKIGALTVKNRIVMPPMNTNYSNENGAVMPQMVEYYVRRARGGAGLIVIEAASVVPDIMNHGVQPMIYSEKFIPGWADMVEKIHRHGTKVSIEIAHYGSEANIGPKYSASDVSRFPGIPVTPFTLKEIQEVEDKFAVAIKHAKAAGFDAVTLHAAHGYGIAQFLSPLYNKRTDSYGGTLENRMRFLIQIIRKSKKLAGKNFPVMVRFSVDEFIENGRTIEESKKIAVMLEAEGVAAIDISAGLPSSYIFTIQPHSLPGATGILVPYAEEIKKVVNIPVICAGMIRDPVFAESILVNGKADMIALGRPLIADPDYPVKASNEDFGSIRPCLSCQTCVRIMDENKGIKCAVNPEAGRECEFTGISTASNTKKVVVVGGGPAGMEAARVAKLRGHDVTLFERSGELGGTLTAGMVPPNKDNIKKLVEWYSRQLKDLNIKLELNTEYTPETFKALKPDAVILAGGAAYTRRIPGSEKSHVITASDFLKNNGKAGKRVVIIGGGATGGETAEYLSGEKVKLSFLGVKNFSGQLMYTKKSNQDAEPRNITIIEMLDEICSDMDEQNRAIMLVTLKENGVKALTSTMVKEITENEVMVFDRNTLKEYAVPADTVILAGGLTPQAMPEVDSASEVYRIGDCNKPGKIIDAIYEAYRIAREI